MNTGEIIVLMAGAAGFVFLVAVRSLTLGSRGETRFELERKARAGDLLAQKAFKEEQLLPDLAVFHQSLQAVLSVIVVACLIYSLGWGWGVAASIAGLIAASLLAYQITVIRLAQKLYRRWDQTVLRFVTRLSPGLKHFGYIARSQPRDFRLHSKQELLHLIGEAGPVLTGDERKLLAHAARFSDKEAHEIMTPRDDVISVKSSEILGPLTLDRLHKTGHAYFPVIKKDLHRVEGILCLEDAVSQVKHSSTSTAAQLMIPKVCYLNRNQTLPSALGAFLRMRPPLFIVVNEQEQTTGVITISDIITALIGRNLPDESGQYEDLHAVASNAGAARDKSYS